MLNIIIPINLLEEDDDMSMFCYQCQEAIGGKGCSGKAGACGKSAEVAGLQDLLLFVTKGVAMVNQCAREKGVNTEVADKYIIDALFTTITNANFDDAAISEKITFGLEVRDNIKKAVNSDECCGGCEKHDAITWTGSPDSYEAKAKAVGVLSTENEDVRSLRELIVYGVKGMAAYYEHATNLGHHDKEVVKFIEEALVSTTKDLSVDELVALTLKTGELAVTTMALLDSANTGTYGTPEISNVNIGVRKNPAILISGHDLADMQRLLEQTEGTGVDVYTHSEMLPANYYPAFKKYEHLAGNYGNAWWKQDQEFASFNGPILMTTNCIVPVKDAYKDRLFTTGSAGYPGAVHIPTVDGQKDFTQIIELAKTCAAPTEIETGEIVGGFAHAQVLALADKVVDAVKTGAVKKFVVMAGCDGRQQGRNYYTDFANELPEDTIILTAGCAKYRYNKLNLGDIGGIPRVLDAGQCNDSYSLAVIAMKLKEVFELEDINDLPIFYNIAWYEQKAVTVLLALLHLGVKNIHLGPTLPAFLSPNVANVLIENFGIGGIASVQEDITNFVIA